MNVPEMLSPEQAFIARYGVEPTIDSLDTAAVSLFNGMEAFSKVLYFRPLMSHRDLESSEQALRLVRIHTREAMVFLFLEGPLNGFPVNLGSDLPKGQKVYDFAEGALKDWWETERNVRKEFDAVIDLLSFASKMDLSWLKKLLGKSSREIRDLIKENRLELNPELKFFLENHGFKTYEERRKGI